MSLSRLRRNTVYVTLLAVRLHCAAYKARGIDVSRAERKALCRKLLARIKRNGEAA